MCVLPLSLDYYREQGGEAYGEYFCIFNNCFNDFTDIKYGLTMYNLHTVGQ